MKKGMKKKLTQGQKILQNPATTKTDSPKIRELKHKARRYSLKEGMLASAKTAFGYNYIAPFAVAINASDSVIAMLSAIAGLFGPLSQIFGSRLIEKYSRKQIMLKTVLFESLMWIPFILIAILFYKGIIISILPLILLLTFAIYILLTDLGHPAWFSWVGDIVDEKYRGRWFSKRTLLNGFVAVVISISASFFLDYTKKVNLTMFGFIILFFLALATRIASRGIFKKQYEPKIKFKKGYYFSFFDFLLTDKKDNFKRFSIYRFWLNLTCSISTPLLVVYLLRYLGFNYTTYMIIIFAGTIFSLLILELWGKFGDLYGNYRILGISSILIPIIPILWILSPNPIYLIFVPSLISGISWAGFNLAAGNFIYDNVSQQKRSLAVSYFNMLGGLGTFIGAGIGAILIKFLTIKIIEPLMAIFILGSLTRMIVVFMNISKIKEIKDTKKLGGVKGIKKLILTETKPTLIEEAHQIMSIKEYFNEK